MSPFRALSFFLASATALFLGVAGVPSVSAAQFDYDLGVYNSTISFSKTTLVAGDSIRVYARIKNEGTKDDSGYASFFQSNQLIGQSQIISVRAGGQDEEVWVDFTVPNGDFNIRVQIQGTAPQDQNAVNDTALSPTFAVVRDGDADGVPDNSDNCPSVANADQLDTDHDGQGDACDADDDNDGVPDANEAALGTSPTNPDSDGDGVTDGQDAFPMDPSRSVVPPPAAPPPPPPALVPAANANRNGNANTNVNAPAASPAPAPVPAGTTVTAAGETTSTPNFVTVGSASGTPAAVPSAAISITRIGWDRFRFIARGADEHAGDTVQWNFGDGSSADGATVEHRFSKPGVYPVSLTVIGADGSRAQDAYMARVAFFDLHNWRLLLLMAFVGVTAAGMVVWAEGARRRAERA